MKQKLLFILMALLSVNMANAGSGGPDAYGYIWKDDLEPTGPVFNWIDILALPGHTLVEDLSDDNTHGPIHMNFNFHYYWYDVNQFWVGSNGYIAFQSAQLSAPFPFIPSTSLPQNFIMPFGTDLNFDGVGNNAECYYWISPNSDSLVVSWIDVPFWDPIAPSYSGLNTFQVILSTVDSSITFQYLTQNGQYNGGTSPYLSCGIENNSGAVGLQNLVNPIPVGSNYMTTPYAVKFYYPATTTYQVIDASTAYNNNPANGGRFVSNNTPEPWRMTSQVKNTGNTILSNFDVCSYVALSWSGLASTILVADTATTPGLNPALTFSHSMAATFSPTIAQTYLQVTKTLYPGDIVPTNDSASMELVAVDTTSGPVLLSFDDGTNDGVGLNWQGGNGGAGMLFVPPYYPCKITKVHAYIAANPIVESFWMGVWDDNGGNGDVGTRLDSVYVDGSTFTAPGWVDVPLTTPIIITSGTFYVSWYMVGVNISLGQDLVGPFSNRTFEVLSGAWSIYRSREFEDLMINATIDTTNTSVGIYETDYAVSSLYPNPANESVTVQINGNMVDKDMVMQIYSSDGKLVSESVIPVNGREVNHTFNVRSLSAGLYSCIFISGNNRTVKKLSINR
jgi:hypothetical protein